jgi:nucleoside-diphosphate-sugar epimerase
MTRPGGKPVTTAEEQIPLDLGGGDPLPAVGPCDVAIFLAQSRAYGSFPEGAPDVVKVNLLGLTQALEIARRSRVRRFLYASTGSVYGSADHALAEGDPLLGTDVYALSKRMGEELVGSWARFFSVVQLRFFALYGPGQEGRMIPSVLRSVEEGRPVYLQPRKVDEPSPSGFRTSPCLVTDAAEALVQLCQASCEGPVNVAGPDAVGIREIAEAAGRLLGREPVFEIADEPRAGDLVASIDRLRAWTSLAPASLETGLETLLGIRP